MTVFKKHFSSFDSPLDKLFVYIVDEMPLMHWIAMGDKTEWIIGLFENNMYNSGVELEINLEDKTFRKITNETLTERIDKRNKEIEHEKFINSIGHSSLDDGSLQ